MEGSFGWGWVVDLKFVFHLLKPINTAMKYFLLKVEISNLGAFTHWHRTHTLNPRMTGSLNSKLQGAQMGSFKKK